MIIMLHNLIYLPNSQSQISSVWIWLTDQNQRPISNREETLLIVLDVREVEATHLEKIFIKAMKSS